MNNFSIVLKNSLKKEFNIEVYVFFFRRKLLHIGFNKAISSYPFFEKVLDFIKSKCIFIDINTNFYFNTINLKMEEGKFVLNLKHIKKF